MDMKRGFSLVELLVALSILAVVAAIIVPRMLNISASAQAEVQAESIGRLNRTFAVWEAAGGFIGSNAATSDILRVLSSPAGTPMVINAATTSTADDVRDGSTGAARSDSYRISLPQGLSLPSGAVATLDYNGSQVYFDTGRKTFEVFDPSKESWSMVSYSGYPAPTSQEDINRFPIYINYGSYWARYVPRSPPVIGQTVSCELQVNNGMFTAPP
jgi:prepilin-type N-terminal cleavage/methylation domain-containing protein